MLIGCLAGKLEKFHKFYRINDILVYYADIKFYEIQDVCGTTLHNMEHSLVPKRELIFPSISLTPSPLRTFSSPLNINITIKAGGISSQNS